MSWVVVQGSKAQDQDENKTPNQPQKELIDQLQLENYKLRALLQQCEAKLEKKQDSKVPEEVQAAADGLYQQLVDTSKALPVATKLPTNTSSSSSSSSSSSTNDSALFGPGSLRPQEKSAFFASGARQGAGRSAIFVCTSSVTKTATGTATATTAGTATGVPGEDEAYVAVMDLNDDDWWEIVEPERDDLEPINMEDADGDGSFVVVEQEDILRAMTHFIKAAVRACPHSKGVAPEKLKRLLDGAMNGLKEKGQVTRMYEWGSFAYTTYGWGSYAWQLYRDPAMVKLVAKGVFSAASWGMWLIL